MATLLGYVMPVWRYLIVAPPAAIAIEGGQS
jgi:hypothetical protein